MLASHQKIHTHCLEPNLGTFSMVELGFYSTSSHAIVVKCAIVCHAPVDIDFSFLSLRALDANAGFAKFYFVGLSVYFLYIDLLYSS